MGGERTMTTPTFEQFDVAYRVLTGHDGACRWQYRLFCELQAGRVLSDVELATGLDKTSSIALWVLALGGEIRRTILGCSARHMPHISSRETAYQTNIWWESVGNGHEASLE
jgi:hypothetical protein